MVNILVLNDLHTGSKYGMLPPGFHTSDGSVRTQNAAQQWLWASWENFQEQVSHMHIDQVIVNGDVIEGEWSRNRKEISIPIHEQEEAAVFILRTLRNKLQKNNSSIPFIIVQGTEVHDGDGAEVLDSIAARLNVDLTNTNVPGGYRSYQEWSQLLGGNVYIHAQHHIGGGGGFARGGPLEHEQIWCVYRSSRGEALPADLILRGHVHNFMHIDKDGCHMMTTPCWQVATRYARKGSAYKLIPSVGAVVITIDLEAKAKGMDPIFHVQKFLYITPPTPAVELSLGAEHDTV